LDLLRGAEREFVDGAEPKPIHGVRLVAFVTVSSYSLRRLLRNIKINTYVDSKTTARFLYRPY